MTTLFSLLVLIVLTQTPVRFGQPIGEFRTLSPQAKQDALRALAFGPDVVSASSIELLEAGLTDDLAQVRYSASAALSRIALRASSSGEQMAELRNRTSLGGVLLASLEDPDFRIRGGAISVLTVMGLPRTPAVLQRLIRHYTREADASVRAVLVKVVGSQAPSVIDAHRLVMKALEDSATEVQHSAIRATFTYQPPEALPHLAAAIITMEPSLRQDAVHAIGLYGPSAKAHVGVLRSLISVETDQERIQHIERAISNITGKSVR
jgi:HEAT repeat protein